ncbi:hypothetical protein [uncultured Nostoc sp.]|uniref:hypothetical protein n=1 Tax=uncultured Nostoc sp. TaxID=340711 RepID=UPI0035CABF46
MMLKKSQPIEIGVPEQVRQKKDLLQESQMRGTSRLDLSSIYDLRTSKEPKARKP